MALAAPTNLRTGLRGLYQRMRSLSPAAQLRECVDQLGHPELLISEFLDAYSHVETHAPLVCGAAEADDDEALVLEHFYPGRGIALEGRGGASFTCVASGIDPVPLGGSPDGADREGLDYAGLGAEGRPLLGAVQSAADGTPYLVLLRLLAGVSELAPRAQLERLDREAFGGRLGAAPVFDLHLVLWRGAEQAETRPLYELTRDLAGVVKQAALDDPLFPDVLGAISAFRMDPDRFDGRLALDWAV